MLNADATQDLPVTEVKVQLLPWRLRVRDVRLDVSDGLAGWDVGDGPVVLLAVVLVLVFATAGGLGVLFFPIEFAAIVMTATALVLLRLLGVLTWHVVIVFADGSTRVERVRGVLAARRRASQLRGQAVLVTT